MTLQEIEADVYQNGAVNRNHVLEFLKLQPTSDQVTITAALKNWLEKLHNDPYYSKVRFPTGDVERILSDLESYGYVTHATIIDAPPPPDVKPGSVL